MVALMKGTVFQTQCHNHSMNMVYNHHQDTATKAVDTASFLTFLTGKPLVYLSWERWDWCKMQAHLSSSKCKNFKLSSFCCSNGKIESICKIL